MFRWLEFKFQYILYYPLKLLYLSKLPIVPKTLLYFNVISNNMKTKQSFITIPLLSLISIIWVVHSIYLTNANGINNTTMTAFAQTQSAATIHNKNTLHAKGLIGSIVSHLISNDVIRSLGFANSTNLVNNTYLSQSAIHNALSGNMSPRMYLAAGTWHLDVIDGKVKDLFANFTQVTTTGINPHTHTITNYRQDNSSNPVKFESKSNTIKITGFADVLRNGQPVKNWMNVPVKVTLSKDNVIGIDVDPIKTDFHFGGTPIFGIVTSLTNQNNNNLKQPFLSPNNVTNTK